MAALVDADPELDPEAWMDRVPSDLWGALVLQVIGQQLSLAAAAAILGPARGLAWGPAADAGGAPGHGRPGET